MAELKVNEITTSTVNATDKVYAFSNLESKAPAVKDLVSAAPGVMATGTCDTLADVATKAVISPDWNAKECQSIIVAFSVANTASDISLSINGGTALPVYAINSSNVRLGSGSIPIGSMIFTLSPDGLKFYAHTNIVSKDSTKTSYADGTDGYTKTQADAIKTNLQDQITANSTNLNTVIGNDTNKSMRAVAEEVVNALPAVYTPKGTVTFANLPALANCQIGWVYNISDSFTTTSDFIEGSGIVKEAGSNIAIIDSDGNGTKKYDILSGAVDLSGYQTKTLSQPISSYTTVEGALQGIINSQIAVIPGNLAGDVPVNGSDLGTTDNNVLVTDANGNLKTYGKTAAALATYGVFVNENTEELAVSSHLFTVNLPGLITEAGTVIKVTFAKALQSSVAITYVLFRAGGQSGAIVAAKPGILSTEANYAAADLCYLNSLEFTGGNYDVNHPHKVWDRYTTLELMWTGAKWLIMGNPVIASYSNGAEGYTVFANGLINQTKVKRIEATLSTNKSVDETFDLYTLGYTKDPNGLYDVGVMLAIYEDGDHYVGIYSDIEGGSTTKDVSYYTGGTTQTRQNQINFHIKCQRYLTKKLWNAPSSLNFAIMSVSPIRSKFIE